MMDARAYRLPVGRAITFDAQSRSWFAHWPERHAIAKESVDTNPSLGPDYVEVFPMIAPPMTPRFLFAPQFLLDTAGLLDGSPLVPVEDLARLRDPPRRSWDKVHKANQDRILPFTKAYAIQRVLAQHHLFASARVGGRSLCGNMDTDEEPITPLPVFHGPCTSCGEAQMVVSTCCRDAIEQVKPRFPRGNMQFFMHDSAYDLGLAEFASAWGGYDRGLSVFMETSFQYPMTCRHVLDGIAGDTLRTLAMRVVHGNERVLAVVFDYLGRQLASSLVAPLFGRTCPRHPSLLDAMDRTGPWRFFNAAHELKELRSLSPTRRLHCAHFYALLSPMLLKQYAMVKAGCAVMSSISQAVAVATFQLSQVDTVAPGDGHSDRHRELMDHWATLWLLFHNPERLVLKCMGKLAETGDYDVHQAAWTPMHYGILHLIFDRSVSLGVIGERELLPVYDEKVVVHNRVPSCCWVGQYEPADAVVFNFVVTLRALLRPMPISSSVCGPRCFSDGYSNTVAAWVREVSALPVRRWWQMSAKRGRSPRRYDDYDSDATEDYLVEEEEEEEKEE